MKWKGPQDTPGIPGEPIDDVIDEDAFPHWEKEKRFSLGETLFKKPTRVPMLAAAGGALLIVLLFVLFSGNDDPIGKETIGALDKRLAELDARISDLETARPAPEAMAAPSREVAELKQRVLQLEASVNDRIQRLSASVSNMQKKAPAPSVSKPAEDTAPVPADTGGEPKIHQVRAGETLYSIARRYGLSVQDLRRLNALESGAYIHPGQKLVVGQKGR